MTRPLALMASIGCALTLGAMACSSSSSSNGTGGAGGGVVPTGGMSGAVAGTTGSGGTGGAGGMSGTTGGAPGTAGSPGAAGGSGGSVNCGALPACIASVVAACPLASNACIVTASASGNTSMQNICFGNPVSVKAAYAVTNDPNTGAGSTAITVTKGGVLCYSLDGTFNALDPLTTPRVLSFKNAAGIELATFTTDISVFPHTTSVTCAGGQAVPVTDFGNCGMPNDPEPATCVGGGTCVAP